MSRHKKPPNRQPRGPRATLPKPEPPTGEPTEHDYAGGAACINCGHWADRCECHLWHLYKECPCPEGLLAAHREAHPAADCPCR